MNVTKMLFDECDFLWNGVTTLRTCACTGIRVNKYLAKRRSVAFHSFVMTKTAPAIIESIGIFGIFGFFSSVAFLAGVFAAFAMPETKGMPLKEIRQIYAARQSLMPEDLKFIEAMDKEDDLNSIKWEGARGRRRTISITV